MFKFKVNKSMQLNGDNSKMQEEFFNLSKISTLGFPHKPSALAWDPFLSLMAIGTQKGSIRVYGAPSVSFSAEHKQALHVVDLLFIPKKGRLISLCTDNSLHLWEFNTVNERCTFTEVKSYTLGGLMKKITTIFLKSSADILFLGTMCGNIYTLDVETFEMAESVIYQDVIMQNIPDNVKLSQGSVRTISEQPGNSDFLLISYQQGLMVLWDNKTLVVVSTFIGSQSVESVVWHRRGERFMSSHSDGSYVIWSTEDPSKPAEVPMTPYGPFACKAINRIIWNTVKGGDDYIIFNGGMPRAVHGEKSTLTIMCGDKHQVLDLTSRVVDFFTIFSVYDESDFDNPHSLVILMEEELLVLDLESDDWLPFRLPYLDIPHASPVTCTYFCSEVTTDVSKLLLDISQTVDKEIYSENVWPITGGKCHQEPSSVQSLLVTGHENGCIKFWNLSPASMSLLYSFHTSHTFATYEKCEDSEELEDWPPFRKIGHFDTLCDDARLSIRRIVFNDITQTLIVGGAAGQILVLTLSEAEAEKDIKPTIVHLVGDYNGTSASGHAPLMMWPGAKTYHKGLHLQALVQMTPPAAVTAVAFHSEWNILAAGTSHGFLLFDVVQKKSIMSKCTISVGETVASPSVSEEVLERSQTLKRSLRESFRKLRKGKSLRQGRDRTGSLTAEMMREISPRDGTLKQESFSSSPDPTIASSPSPELRSFASESESRQSDVSSNSSVQCVYFAQSFIINNIITTPTFWAGTSNGFVYIYTITMPASENRTTDTVTCQLGKEIQLRHRAPVISIKIVDHTGYPLPDPLEVQQQRAKPADLCRSHRVVVCSEEQIKVFTLPSMKSLCKYKITLLERCHISHVAFATFQSKASVKNTENCAICITNTNEIALYSVPDLRKQISFQYASADDMSVLSSFAFTRNGKFIYMVSPSEFEMRSLSSLHIAQTVCSIELPEGARDMPEPKNSIVLEVRNIRLDSGDNGVNSTDGPENTVSVDSGSQPEQVQSIEEESGGATEASGNHANSSSTAGSIVQQLKRAPLARIDELNTSDEHSSNHSSYLSRRSYCGSN